jgi:hypothetical protein
MKTYIIDWGANANGGRFALIQASSMGKAFWEADSIGSPFDIAELRIPKDQDGVRYAEIDIPATQYAGASLPDCGAFLKSRNLLDEAIAS